MWKIGLAALPALLAASLVHAGPDLRPGDSFTYQSRSETYTHTYEGAGPKGGHVFRLDNGDRLTFDASLSLTGIPGSRMEPHNGQLALDPEHGFEVGQSWQVSYQILRDDGSGARRARSCEVTAHEPALVVRAGTFDAYRVDCVVERPGGRLQYGESWYDARSWRTLVHHVGDSANDLEKILELVEIQRAPR